MIEYQCSNCGQKFKSDDKHAEKKGKCHNCGKTVLIPKIANQNISNRKIKNESSNDAISPSISQENTLKESSKKQPQLFKKYVAGTLIIVLFLVIGFFVVRNIIETNKAVQRSRNSTAYWLEGKDYPSEAFMQRISEMKDFLKQTKPVAIELKSISRNLEMGATYAEYKASILRLGTACDGIIDIPNCFEATKLKLKAREALRFHESAFSNWKMFISFDDYHFDIKRDEDIEKASTASQEFFDYCNYILEECEKRS